MKNIFIFLGIVSFIFLYQCSSPSVLPKSKIAEIVESPDPTKRIYLATGIGKKYENAVEDARKAALYADVQRELHTIEERQSFEMIAEDFFKDYAKMAFPPEVKKRISKGNNIEIQALVKINHQEVIRSLKERGIIKEVTKNVGNPTLMVIPTERLIKTSWREIAENSIKEYLLSRKFEVLEQAPQSSMAELVDEIGMSKEGMIIAEKDSIAAKAMETGADIYITYEVDISKEEGGVKGFATIKAYETTTARLLGTGIATSKTYPKDSAGAQQKCVVEAIGDATEKAILTILDYWKQDIEEGQRYYILVTGNFISQRGKEVKRAIYQVLKSNTTEIKQNLETDTVMEYLVRAKKDNIELVQGLEDELENKGIIYEWGVKNRKMLVLLIK